MVWEGQARTPTIQATRAQEKEYAGGSDTQERADKLGLWAPNVARTGLKQVQEQASGNGQGAAAVPDGQHFASQRQAPDLQGVELACHSPLDQFGDEVVEFVPQLVRNAERCSEVPALKGEVGPATRLASEFDSSVPAAPAADGEVGSGLGPSAGTG